MRDDNKISIVFFGTPDFACPSLSCLHETAEFDIKAVVTQTSKPKGRGQKEQDSAIYTLAKEKGIASVLRPKKLRLTDVQSEDEDALKLAEILSQQPIDFCIVVAYGKIIPKSLLQIPRFGFLNVHPSALPQWRGAAPLQHTILSGAHTTKVCIIKLVEELDAGPIYLSKEIQNIESCMLQDLHTICAKVGSELLKETILNIFHKNIQPTPQANEEVTYAHKWTKNDCRINFSESPQTTYNRIRASSPSPGAFCYFEKNLIKLFSVSLLNIPNSLNTGQLTILPSAENIPTLGIALDTSHILEVSEIQLEGKSKTSSRDFLNTKNLRDRLRSGETILLTSD